jgi:hypothetical protein
MIGPLTKFDKRGRREYAGKSKNSRRREEFETPYEVEFTLRLCRTGASRGEHAEPTSGGRGESEPDKTGQNKMRATRY